MTEISSIALDLPPLTNEFIVNPERYYGVQSPYKKKGFITREQYSAGCFNVLTPVLLTQGNGWAYKNQSLAKLINELKAANFRVFEFDSYQEMFRWLIQL